ncbi:MAG: urease-associated protein [Mesorhizobium sp. SCN 65-20]|nr:MAG: urease-associated protein [Mesorhizobium sp. SCN 65-20]
MGRARRGVRFLGGAVMLLVLALLLGTLVPRPLIGRSPAAAAERHLLVLTNPIHTDIAVPIDEAVLQRFGFLEDSGVPAYALGARYLVFGWGSRAFYLETPTWADLKPGPLLKALTLDRSALHVDVMGEIAMPHPAVARFEVGEAEFEAMLEFITASFQRDGSAIKLIKDAGYGQTDAFFEANGYFNALAGCNTWAAAALRKAGLTTGWWNPLPVTLGWSLSLYNSASDQPGGVQP